MHACVIALAACTADSGDPTLKLACPARGVAGVALYLDLEQQPAPSWPSTAFPAKFLVLLSTRVFLCTRGGKSLVIVIGMIGCGRYEKQGRTWGRTQRFDKGSKHIPLDHVLNSYS